MSKNLKDIFETGRKRLDELADKRKELLDRCAALKNGAGEQRLQESYKRLDALETSTTEQISLQVDATIEMHQEVVDRIIESNQRYLSEAKEEYEFRVSKLLKELHYLKEWYADLCEDKVDQMIVPLQQAHHAARAVHQSLVRTNLNDLDAAARKVGSIISEEKERSSSNLAGNIKESQDKLNEILAEVSKELQEQTSQLAESIKSDHAENLKTLKATCAEIEAELIKVNTDQPAAIEAARAEIEADLQARFEKICTETQTKLSEENAEREKEFRTTLEEAIQGTEQVLVSLREQTQESVDKLVQLLADAEKNNKEASEKTFAETRKRYDDALQAKALELSSDSAKALLEEMSAEMQKMSSDLSRQLNTSLQLYKDRFASLLTTAEKNFTISLDSMRFEVDRTLDMQRAAFEEKDKQLNSRLSSLEDQYAKIMAGMAES